MSGLASKKMGTRDHEGKILAFDGLNGESELKLGFSRPNSQLLGWDPQDQRWFPPGEWGGQNKQTTTTRERGLPGQSAPPQVHFLKELQLGSLLTWEEGGICLKVPLSPDTF